MTSALELNLAARYLAVTPARLAIAHELRSPMSFFDPRAGFEQIGSYQENIYSLSCRTEILLEHPAGTSPIVINDLRMCEIALDLITAAIQETVESQADLMHFLISRFVLEQSVMYHSPALKAGLFADRVNSEVQDRELRRKHDVSFVQMSIEQDRYHLEQIVQFMLAHETTHYCLFNDERFRINWVAEIRDRFSAILSTWDEDEPTPGPNNFLRGHLHARVKECDEWAGGDLPEKLEETICDACAMVSLVHTMHNKGALKGRIAGIMLSIHASLSATWLVTMGRKAVRELLTTATTDLSEMAVLLQERTGVAMVVLAQTIGESLMQENAKPEGMLVESWRAQPDFEEMILESFNSLFAMENLERAMLIGDSLQDTGFCSARTVNHAILKHFGWSA